MVNCNKDLTLLRLVNFIDADQPRVMHLLWLCLNKVLVGKVLLAWCDTLWCEWRYFANCQNRVLSVRSLLMANTLINVYDVSSSQSCTALLGEECAVAASAIQSFVIFTTLHTVLLMSHLFWVLYPSKSQNIIEGWFKLTYATSVEWALQTTPSSTFTVLI